MLAAVRSAAVLGIDAYDVIVEVDAAQGLPQWTIVGLPAGAVKESRERVGAALVNSGFALPPRRITVNLAPADVRKDGTAFDLPIALGILVATGQLPARVVERRLFVGELGLDGSLRSVRGALPIARRVACSAERIELVLPRQNVAEAGRVSAVSLAAPVDLSELARGLANGGLAPALPEASVATESCAGVDLSDVAGQGAARRALEIAAAGAHNLFMIGPPGAGKTMLARRLPTILPPLSESETLEVIAIHSVAGTLAPESIVSTARPFRAPHHSISGAGLIGGGSWPRPGEVSLAHAGVLFLDEMLEFPRSVLESLRQPMEDGRVVVARAASSVTFPARFTLIGAANPCACGRAGDSTGVCTCSQTDLQRYSRRMSGPLSDRIDMNVAVTAVPLRALSLREQQPESSCAVRQRVGRARERQGARFQSLQTVACNAHASGRWMDANGLISAEARKLLQRAAARLSLSARGYHRILKVARTIADLDESAGVGPEHMSEALRYRRGLAQN